MGDGPVPPLPAIEAPAPLLAAARTNCAERYAARGQHSEAAAFATGERDAAWAMRHEVNKLRVEDEARALQPAGVLIDAITGEAY